MKLFLKLGEKINECKRHVFNQGYSYDEAHNYVKLVFEETGLKFGVFDYVTKVLMDFLNRRAFENFNAKTRKELMSQIVKFLDNITGPDKLIEDFSIRRFEQDPNQKDRVFLDIHMKPYFPAKNFMIKMDGQKGDDGTEWDADYEQQ